MKRLSRYVEALRLGAVIDSKAPSGGAAAGQTIILPVYETEQVFGLGAASTSQTIFVCDNVSGSYVVAGLTVVFGTASASGTVQVEVAGSGVAQGSGTNQLTGTVALTGTANTPTNGTLIASPTTIVAGSRVNIIFGGTLTSLANANITVILQRVA
jgi:hypothetical protein